MGHEENIFIPSRLKTERTRLDLTQDEVAAHCQTTVQTVRRWEKRPIIPAGKLSVLAGHGFDVQYILTGTRCEQQKLNKGTQTLNDEQREILTLWRRVPMRAKSSLIVLMQQLAPHTDMSDASIEFIDPDKVHSEKEKV